MLTPEHLQKGHNHAGMSPGLDTHGINAWCAAGKDTFSTDEIVRRVRETGLHDVVTHRKLIVPQLGAPWVAAHEVRRRSGFRVVYGSVRARDLRAFLEARMQATDAMRRLEFPPRQAKSGTPIPGSGKFKNEQGGGSYRVSRRAIHTVRRSVRSVGQAQRALRIEGAANAGE